MAFAVVVTLLAAACVILALVVAAYWLLVQVRLRAQPRQPPDAWWREHRADEPAAAAMRAVGRWLLVGWLLAALVLLGMGGRLPVFLGWAGTGSLLVFTVAGVVRQQLAPSMLARPALPERYRVADDLRQPIAAGAAAAEASSRKH